MLECFPQHGPLSEKRSVRHEPKWDTSHRVWKLVRLLQYVFLNETQDPPVRVRKQKTVKLGPAEGRGKLTKSDAYVALAKEISKAQGTSAEPARDGSTTLEQFSETRWLPLREGTLRKGSKDSLNQRLKIIYKQFGSKRLDQLDKVALQNWLNTMARSTAMAWLSI